MALTFGNTVPTVLSGMPVQQSAMLDEELLHQEKDCFVSRLKVERQRRVDLAKVLNSGPSVKSTESGKVVRSFPPGQGFTYSYALATKFDQVTRHPNKISSYSETTHDIKSRSALQDSMSKGMMGTMIAATEGDGSLAFLCRNPDTHMRNIRSSAIEFFADRTSHVHASNAIKVFTLGLFRAKFREALHVRAMDGACLERYEKDDVADWRLAIRTSSGSDNSIGGFERVDCTEKRAWNELVYYASLEVLIHLKEATKTALETVARSGGTL
ncbi:hypothetical protein FVE85_8850 [Porphyridium purpureum]|uniref:Uncharacterized protein n=1 Tax=Porphyridium purpureum TaxID=35688 RepID=A0A5J4YQA0_PORPP|nr:hypothetical protein FVE85_8850 [Porphyridium purpureum]|eukprot:POR5979..scf296_7